MTDIVERLREGCGCNFPETTCMAESECADAFEAADEITRLRADNERLREALREIASGKYSGIVLTSYPPQDPAVNRARAALDYRKMEEGRT